MLNLGDTTKGELTAMDWHEMLDKLLDKSGCWVTGNGGSSGLKIKAESEK